MKTLRVWLAGTQGQLTTARTYDAALLMLTRDGGPKGELMLTFVADRQTRVVPFADVLKVEVVQ